VFILLSLAALAEQPYIGSWANVSEAENSETILTVFRLFPDYSAAYLSQQFPKGKTTSGIFTWEEINDSSFRILNSKKKPIGEYYLVNKSRAEDKQRNVFVKISFESTSNDAPSVTAVPTPEATKEANDVPGNLQDGLLLYPGQYIIGTDIPAGDYRFEYYKAPVDIFIHKDPNSAAWSGFASVTKNSQIFAKINLPEGGRLDVGAFPVIIMYAKPLDLGE
jgi:hypothetical protein